MEINVSVHGEPGDGVAMPPQDRRHGGAQAWPRQEEVQVSRGTFLLFFVTKILYIFLYICKFCFVYFSYFSEQVIVSRE